jgi:hypothetical protein
MNCHTDWNGRIESDADLRPSPEAWVLAQYMIA